MLHRDVVCVVSPLVVGKSQLTQYLTFPITNEVCTVPPKRFRRSFLFVWIPSPYVVTEDKCNSMDVSIIFAASFFFLSEVGKKAF